MRKFKILTLFIIIFSISKGGDEIKNEFSGFSLEGFTGLQFANFPNSINKTSYALGVFPRYNFYAPVDYFSVSVGSPSSIGFELFAGTGGSAIGFLGDIPITLDINLGDRATDNNYLFGFFAGGGINYNYTYYNYTNTGSASIHSFGPVIHAGFRWVYRGRPTGLRISYMNGIFNNQELPVGIINLEKGNPEFVSIAILYKFF